VEVGIERALWEISSYSLINWWEMLEFNAETFFYLSARLHGLSIALTVSPDSSQVAAAWDSLGQELEGVRTSCEELGLTLSVMQANRAIASWEANRRADCGAEIIALKNRISDEFSQRKFFCVEKDRTDFLSRVGDWTELERTRPSVVIEIARAARCFEYGENTSAVFHLMRVVDSGLRAVAASLGIGYSANNWSGIGDDIRKKMEQKYQAKTEEWRKSEPFYAEILTDLQAISKGHRNPVLHEIERSYDEKETRYLITVIFAFTIHIGKKLPEPKP